MNLIKERDVAFFTLARTHTGSGTLRRPPLPVGIPDEIIAVTRSNETSELRRGSSEGYCSLACRLGAH